MKFVEVTCCSCNILFGLEEGCNRQLVESKNLFYCPNGHSQYYTGENKNRKIREQNEKIKKLREENESLERRLRHKNQLRDSKGKFKKKPNKK